MEIYPAPDPPAERLRGSLSRHLFPPKKAKRSAQTGTTRVTHSPHLIDQTKNFQMSKSPPPSMQDYNLTTLIAHPQFTSCPPLIRRAWITLWRSVYRTYIDDMTQRKFSSSDGRILNGANWLCKEYNDYTGEDIAMNTIRSSYSPLWIYDEGMDNRGISEYRFSSNFILIHPLNFHQFTPPPPQDLILWGTPAWDSLSTL